MQKKSKGIVSFIFYIWHILCLDIHTKYQLTEKFCDLSFIGSKSFNAKIGPTRENIQLLFNLKINNNSNILKI
jgi:hypothetical protein